MFRAQQVFHVCDMSGRQDSFLCPNGTIFSQQLFACDWWYNVKCSATRQHYQLNSNLFKVKMAFSLNKLASPSLQMERRMDDVLKWLEQ